MPELCSHPAHFIRQLIEADLEEGRIERLVTRFPPEPNGYLHIGHAKALCLNFDLAQDYDGHCYLRFDDTNPATEEQHYIDAIKADVRWLGFKWDGAVRYSSDYFAQLYEWALYLIEQGKAYVCHLSAEEASDYRGWATRPGRDSPYRERQAEENKELFEQMRGGQFAEGSCVLRAKIDMASPNMNLRDPVLYRIRHQTHHQTSDQWCIYPSYDFAHGQVDALEGVTHSLCTLEFADHRPLYDWLLEQLPVPSRPRQYEFGRLHLANTVTSKRQLKQLVEDSVVSGWDDPRMPTLSGMRRRGYRPEAIKRFCASLAFAKTDGIVERAQLDFFVRDDLNHHAPRAMAVLRPLKVVIVNYAENEVEKLTAPCHPEHPMGDRELLLTREIVIDRNDFKEEYSKKWKKKWSPGRRIRLRYAYVLEAIGSVKNEQGELIQINAHLIEHTLGRDPEDGNKPKGVVHWVSATQGKRATLRLYADLFKEESARTEGTPSLNPCSLQRVEEVMIEPSLAEVAPEQWFQFEREGYFISDRYDHSAEQPVFNRIIGLRDTR